ncbi:MAG: class I SAM-dependent methyltransferase [Rhodospirillaceae bacterium]|nr:MAG: class I SAM-dependent methyltransferase [Rhodospirillaceae bacterium]
MEINAQYNVAKAGSLPVRIAGHQRQKMYREFLDLGVGTSDTILDIGVTSDQSYAHSNYLEAWYPSPEKITAIGLDVNAAFLTKTYPGLQFVVANGCMLPFGDNAFDYVHASAVMEHVGSRSRQAALMSEAHRVARKAVFLTTPNRWFPIEFHTVLPLVHWLPPTLFRAFLAAIGMKFFASEDNLHLLAAKELRAMARSAGFTDSVEVRGVRLCGLISNLLFILRKQDRA